MKHAPHSTTPCVTVTRHLLTNDALQAVCVHVMYHLQYIQNCIATVREQNMNSVLCKASYIVTIDS